MRSVARLLVLLLLVPCCLAQEPAPAATPSLSPAAEKIHRQAVDRAGRMAQVEYRGGGGVQGTVTEAKANALTLRSKDSGKVLEIPYDEVRKIGGVSVSLGKKVAIFTLIFGGLAAALGSRV